jgi:two-component system, NarL family, sensor histidine kinase DegS
VGYISANVAQRRSFARMTDSVAPSPEVSASVNPAVVLREVLETRVARDEEEIALIERRYRQLQTRINQGQERRGAADATWRVMLGGLDRYLPEDVRTTFEAYSNASAELALDEQRFDELTGRLGEARDRIKDLRGDLELLADTLRHVGAAPGPDSSAFRTTSRQIFQIIEEERMRIARDMHDGPAQSMSNLVLQAEILERLVDKPDAILAELQDFKSAVRSALDETRQLIFDLRPMTLDDLGLVPTLRRYTREYTEQHGILVRLNLVGGEGRLPGNIEGTLFRIIQEALTNAHKHSRARMVEVDLNLTGERVLASVRDDGVGFDVRAVEAGLSENRNLGLLSMRERCELEHGVMEVKSQPGKGTEIRMEFRLDQVDRL